MARKQTTVVCGCCGGTGRVPLSSLYLETLALLRKHGPTTGAALSKIAGCKATAMNNRLKGLERHGLAKGRRDGRKVFYTAGAGAN